MLPSVMPLPKMICAHSGTALATSGTRGHVHRQAEAGRDDDDVAVVVEVHPRQGLDADDRDGREHRHGGAAEHRVRDARDDRAGLGDQPEMIMMTPAAATT